MISSCATVIRLRRPDRRPVSCGGFWSRHSCATSCVAPQRFIISGCAVGNLQPSHLCFLAPSSVLFNPLIHTLLHAHYPLPVRSLSAYSVLFRPLSPVPPLPFIPFSRPFSPFSVFSRPSGSPFPLLVAAVNLMSEMRLDNTQRRPFLLNVSLCRAPMTVSPGCCYHTCCSVRLLPVK